MLCAGAKLKYTTCTAVRKHLEGGTGLYQSRTHLNYVFHLSRSINDVAQSCTSEGVQQTIIGTRSLRRNVDIKFNSASEISSLLPAELVHGTHVNTWKKNNNIS